MQTDPLAPSLENLCNEFQSYSPFRGCAMRTTDGQADNFFAFGRFKKFNHKIKLFKSSKGFAILCSVAIYIY